MTLIRKHKIYAHMAVALAVLAALLVGPGVPDADAAQFVTKAWIKRYGTKGFNSFRSAALGGDGSLYAVDNTWTTGGLRRRLHIGFRRGRFRHSPG
ncbi:MAG: hypothetical protein LBK28_09180 [Propionibacteriaceae bacterium]|nr:hypothetical protein [Propionibacteriaceae bacterium]